MGKKTKQDPTGQSVNRRRATRRLRERLTLSESQVKRLFRTIPRTRRQVTVLTNAVIPVYDYQITAAELEDLERRVRAIVSDNLLETQFNRMPPNWWWQGVIEEPYRQGTLEELVQFNRLVTAELVRTRAAKGIATQPLNLTQVLQSSEYLETLDTVYVRNFQTIKTLSDRTSDQVMQQINLGIDAGSTPTEIAQTITERFDVSRSSAERTANTEVNRAYNDARLDATDIAADQTGLRAGVLHLSALLPTTRAEHGDRHGDAFTTEQQRQWWNSGSNRIRCHCSTRGVLIDRQGRVVDLELQEDLQAEREFFDDPTGGVKPKAKPKAKPVQPPIQQPKKTPEVIKAVEKADPVAPVQKVRKTRKPQKVEDQKIAPKDSPPKVKKVKLTGDEEAYVEYYKGDGYYKHNEVLRNPDAFSPSEVESAGKMRDSINSAVAKSEITQDGVVYRGIKSPEVFKNAEGLIGKTVPITTAQSTSTNAGTAVTWSGAVRNKKGEFFSGEKDASVIFKIKTKKGQHALNLESLSMGNTGEKEMLLGSGGRYKVTGVRELKDSEGRVTVKIIEADYDE